MTGRGQCPTCGATTIQVRMAITLGYNSHVTVDWPHCNTGDIGITQTATGGWDARYLPVGEPLRPGENRYRKHDCDLHQQQRAEWKARLAQQAADKRNRRGRGRPPIHVGVRKAQ